MVGKFLQLFRFFRDQERQSARDGQTVIGGARIIYDRHMSLGNFEALPTADVNTAINKEADARRIIFSDTTPAGTFFEIGCGDAQLAYLLGVQGNFATDEAERAKNRALFDAKFQYQGVDLEEDLSRNIFSGDICSPDFLASTGIAPNSAAVVYSNNVFEHLRRPWIAAENAYSILKPGGVCITVVPFSQRYHQSPDDYFRYTHKGIASLFADAGDVEEILSGYDILGRRNNWQGGGKAADIIPVDAFGAWRETWFTFHAFRKRG
jgi:SAM-dependent methyltransferase